MSFLSSSTPSTQRAVPACHTAVHSRRGGRAVYIFLVSVILIAGLALYRGAVPPLKVLRTPLTSQSSRLKGNDQSLRQLAIKAPPPSYPPTSLANNVTGVVVAAVTIDVNGQLRSVTIVESPDAATGRAVRDAVRQWVFRPLGVPTPADVITGNLIFYFHFAGGRGMVSSSEEIQALTALSTEDGHLPNPPVVRAIDEAELRRLRDTSVPVVLDIRSRAAHLQSHRDGAVNIPLRELQTRGGAELPRSRLIVVDCFAEQQHSGLCGMAVHMLTSDGFSEVAVLNRTVDWGQQ